MSGLRRKILACDRGSDRQKCFGERRLHAREISYRCEKRQAKTHIFQHVTVLRQNEPFGPVTGVRELVVRVTRIHPGLAVPRIVVGKRKMRTSVAERFADGDPFGVKSVRHAAYGRLRSFLVDVPLVEMLDGPRIHGDQRRVDDRTGIHQRGREGIAACLDCVRKSPSDHAECMPCET